MNPESVLTGATASHPRNLGAAIRHNALLAPERGFIFQDLDGIETAVGFADLEATTAARARALHHAGLARGDCVVVVAVEPSGFVLNFLAAIRLGAIPIPLYANSTVASESLRLRIRGILQVADVRMLIAPSRILEAFDSLRGSVVLKDEVIDDGTQQATTGTEPPLDVSEPDDTAYVQFTSGSTIEPRGVLVTHRMLIANSSAIREALEVDIVRDVGVSWLPLGHDMGLVGFVLAPILWGGPSCVLIPTTRFVRRPAVWMDAIDRHRGSITFAPPYALTTVCRTVGATQLETWNLSCLRVVGVGAEPIDATHLDVFAATMSGYCNMPANAVTPAYGLAEATLAVTMKPCDMGYHVRRVDAEVFRRNRLATDAGNESNVMVHVSCGVPLSGCEVRIVGAEGTSLPENHEGRIEVRGACVCRHNLVDHELKQVREDDGWIDTGDLGYRYGGELYVSGRVKNLLVIHGVNYQPESIEWAIYKATRLTPGSVAVFSRPGPRTEELVVLIDRRAARNDTERSVRDAIDRHFSLAVADIAFVAAAELPRTPSGKLRRGRLRESYLARWSELRSQKVVD